MNKIYKVIYSKVRQCYVVVSEIAKSHGRHTHSSVAKTSSALTAAVLFALGAVSFTGVPVAQADGTQSLRNNDFVGANEYYWYFDEKTNTWTKYPYWGSDAFNNRSRQKVPNYLGGGAKEPGSFAGGLYAQAGQETITIGDRNAGQSKGSVFIGEQGKYNDGGDNNPSEESMHNNYVTAVGFQSDATGWGSIAIGSNAVAENTQETSQVVEMEGSAGTSGTVKDDVYGIKLKPEIKWSSVALGYNAHAKDGNIAIGAYSQATEDSSTPYVSVGGTMTNADGSTTPIQRRITNVADGSADTDVATVGQMNKAIESAGATGWTLSTNGSTSGTTIKSGTRVDFSPAVDGKNGTADHSNVAVSNKGSNVKIGLNRNIVLGEATSGNGGSLNVYSDSTEASNLGNRVSIDGSTVSVNYGSEKGTSGTKRGVVLGVGEDYNNNAQGYIAFNNIDAKRRIGSTYLHSATDAPNDLKGRLVYSNAIDGTEYIANLDDGITFTGDVNGTVPEGYTQTPTKLNTTLNITGGATTKVDLTSGNIGVVSTPAAEKEDGTTQASKLEIKLNKDLKGITSITSKSTTNSTGAKIELGANGTTISGGNVNVSNNKVTGLAKGDVSDTSTDAITGKQLYDAKNALTVKKGWGIKITDNGSDGKTIELERNLGKNYGVTKDSNSKGKVEFEATGNNSLILGGSAINDTWYAYEDDKNKYLDHAYGTFQDDSVLVGGENNATGTKNEKNSSREKGSVVVGGRYNTASGYYTLINGGSHNITNGVYSAILGGYKNEVQKSDWAGYSTIVGGTYNIASGTGATAVGGGDDFTSDSPIKNKASGSYSTTVGGKGNEASGKLSVTVGGVQNKADGWETVVIGGFNNEALSYYGNQSHGKQPFTEGAIVVGGQQNKNSGRSSSIFGGISNLISINASTASIVGGVKNFASGDYTTVGGGQGNVVLGYNSTAFGGFQSIVNGRNSTGIAGGSTENNADLSLAAGYQSTVTGDAIGWEYLSVTKEKYKELMTEMQSGKMSGYYQYAGQSDGKYTVLHYKDISTALGYQATADESGTIALGHDKGDTFLTYKWQQKAWKDGNSYYTRNINTGGVKEISEEEYQKLRNSDGTWNDYTISPNVERGTYDTAYYNRLVKADDGRDAHDVVVREQLTPYTKSDATNIGANLKTYTVGNDGETITEADASDADKTVNENAWGTAIGNGKIADPTKSDTNDPKANGSKQLVTGGTVYSYNKPVAVSADKPLKYVKEGKTTGENLGILDATLNDKNHNIKYYAVDETTLPKLTNFNGKDYSNEKNDGAKGMGSIAAGFNTHADGIASTVAGSYSGVINTGDVKLMGYDFRGATALSYGTFNVNKSTDQSEVFSGVANSIVGQANATTDSNAVIIYGAGNTVTNSYRKIDDTNASEIMKAALSKDVKKLDEALQKAVPTSGGQVMVMGGGNNVESAYMTQVVGVGNTVKGNQVQNAKGEWVTDTSKETAIKDYDDKESSQYNYVDGFNNEVINGKHDYIIGANNTLTGDSYDDNSVKPIKKSNQSNIVIGDNHTLDRKKNTVIIGSSDTANTVTNGSDAVIIGHNANAASDTGADNAVAIGLSAKAAGGNAVSIGANTSAGADSVTIGSVASAVSGSNIAIGRYARVYGNKVTNAVALGQNANALVADGVAIGSGSQATVKGDSVEGYDPVTGKDSTDATATWKAKKAAVSIGTADGKVTRQINGLAAGTNDTDAVNVAQLKKLEGMKANVDASNIGVNLKGADGKAAPAEAQKANAEKWGSAIGTGKIEKDNGQLVTGKTVYEYNKPIAEDGKKLNYVSEDKTTGQNLGALDSQVKTNADNIGTNTTNITKNAGDITNLKNLSNITNEGQKVIKNLSKDAVKVTAGDRVTVTSTEDKNAGTITYQVSAKNDGKVAAGDQNLVSGDTVNTAITNAGTATDTKLAGKANVDASNIGVNLKGADGKAASTEAQKANAEKWGSAIGTGKIEKDNGQLVTGKTVYEYNKPIAEDGKELNYVSEKKTTGQNLGALDSQVKTNADNIAKNTGSIQNITNNMKNLGDNAVQYDKDSNKSKVTLGGKDGTVITNVKDGALSENSKDAVNGKQLYNEQQAREAADKAITEKVTNNTNEITKIKNGDFTDASKTAIHNIAKDAVAVVNGKNTTVTKVDGTDTTPTTYAVNVEGTGKVAAGDTGLISGDTLYKEVHIDKDGAYIKGSNTVGQNLSNLDTGLKTTSDLIHTNAKGDTIQIGGNSTATKIDISGKDKDGKSTGRVITGIVSDANDPNSAANVGYVNGITSASNEQIYRDMNMQYNHVENDISRAAAGSNALAALHPMQEFDPDDKAQFALGYGHYRNSNAGAVGAFYQPDENSMVNFGVSFGNGDAGINAGVTFKFGPGGSGHHALTKTQMAKVIDAQSKEIDELKKDNADKDKRIDALEQKMTEILAKLDKSKD